MRVSVTYCYPDMQARTYIPLARRFVESYMKFPPGSCDHEVNVIVNYGKAGNPEYKRVFRPLGCNFHMHDNRGKDIGAFQMAATAIKCDLMLFLGAPVHFRRGGWLDRIVNVYEQNGPGLYGAWGFHLPKPHIRTTAFWCAPELLNSYPYVVHNDSRYEFEHGDRSFTGHVKGLGLETYQVTWDGCYPQSDWGHVPLDQCLFLDQHTARNGLT